MGMNIERLIHSFKTALACLVGFALTKALHRYLLFDQWLLVTILVVMCAQISVGSIIFKSTVRLLGTLLGTLLATLTLLSVGDNTLCYALVIAFAGFIFSYFATGEKNYSDAGTLGAVTTTIILINPQPTPTLAAERFFEITLGILLATLISQFILPIHARTHLRRSQARALKLLAQFYRKSLALQSTKKGELAEIDEQLIRSLATQRKLAQEAKRELLGSRFEPERFRNIMEGEKRILRSIDFLQRLYSDPEVHAFLETQVEWRQFNRALADNFDQLALRVVKPTLTSAELELPSLKALKNKLMPAAQLPGETLSKIQALLFCLEQVLALVKDLAAAVG